MSRLYTYSVDYIRTNIRSAYQSSGRLVACSDRSLKHDSRRDADAPLKSDVGRVNWSQRRTHKQHHSHMSNMASLSKPVRLYINQE